MPTTLPLPDGWRIARTTRGRDYTAPDVRVYFEIYKPVGTSLWANGEERVYHQVELWWEEALGGGEFVPHISTASSSDKSVELATCICSALADAIAEAWDPVGS